MMPRPGAFIITLDWLGDCSTNSTVPVTPSEVISTVPVATRLVIFSRALRPPLASRYLSRIEATEGIPATRVESATFADLVAREPPGDGSSLTSTCTVGGGPIATRTCGATVGVARGGAEIEETSAISSPCFLPQRISSRTTARATLSCGSPPRSRLLRLSSTVMLGLTP